MSLYRMGIVLIYKWKLLPIDLEYSKKGLETMKPASIYYYY